MVNFSRRRRLVNSRPGQKPALEILEDRTLLSFNFGINYNAGLDPGAEVVGDFNGDGHEDLAVLNTDYNAASVSVLLGTGTGAFEPPRRFPLNHHVLAIATGDFNNDGIADLVIADGQDGTVSVLLGNGDGSFQAPIDSVAGGILYSVAVGDFDGDGVLDLAVANQPQSVITILRGNGDGTFQRAGQYQVGAIPEAVATADLNGDGRLDLVSDNYRAQTVSVLLGNGDGSFQNAVDYSLGGYSSNFTLGDFNHDGHLDLAATVNSPSDSVSVLLGNGDGSFQSPTFSAAGRSARSLVAADFDGDGNLDLAVADWNPYGGGSVQMLRGNGDGSFQPPASILNGSYGPYDLTVGDFDGDNAPDLAVPWFDQYPQGHVTALLNHPTIPIRLHLEIPTGAAAGQALPVSIVPEDIQTGVTVGYAGPIQFASSDPAAILPRSDQVVIGADGTLRAMVTLPTQGDQSLTVTDAALTSLTDQAPVTISSPVHFNLPQTYGLTGTLTAVLEGDLNGDGIPDLVAVDHSGNVSVLLGNGDGSFQAPRRTASRGGATSAALGDVNGDGIPDLVLGFSSSDRGEITVLLGNGDGTFRVLVPITTYQVAGVALGDFNGDGHLDIATDEQILLGNGDGTFQAARGLGAPGLSVAAADLNGDGRLDLVVTGFGRVSVRLGNGDGSFAPPQNYPVGSGPESVTVADINGDGIPDIVTANAGDDTVSILLGNGDGTFGPRRDFRTGLHPLWVAVADINGDGIPDLITADNFGNSASVLLGNGDGSFQEPLSFGTALDPVAVVVDDFNGDGSPELAVANASGSISVLTNLADWSGGGPTAGARRARVDSDRRWHSRDVAIADAGPAEIALFADYRRRETWNGLDPADEMLPV